MDTQKLEQMASHTANWVLGAISRSLQIIGQLQVDQTLSADEKNAQINMHQSLIVNLTTLIVPFIDIVEDIFPQYKSLIDWIKNTYQSALDNKVIAPCGCATCTSRQTAPDDKPSVS